MQDNGHDSGVDQHYSLMRRRGDKNLVRDPMATPGTRLRWISSSPLAKFGIAGADTDKNAGSRQTKSTSARHPVFV